MKEFKITKKAGHQVVFEESKLRASLESSGASLEQINQVVEELYLYMQDGMSTHKVYKKAYSILSKLSHGCAGRYRLKHAIMELGPTGYPFEKFIGALLENQGYDAVTGEIIKGKCVNHEVDVVAENENKIIVVECKFHHEGKGKSDVKIPMYINSRFNDILDVWQAEDKLKGKKFEGWLVTNTRFTEDAENFGRCSGLKLLSWDYPSGKSLKDMVDMSGLHPLTSLKSLTSKEKTSILDQGVVLCKELTEEVLINSNINSRKFKRILKEAKHVSQM